MSNRSDVIVPRQGIVPESATAHVKELFVPASRVEVARREAAQLDALDINQVRPQALRSNLPLQLSYDDCPGTREESIRTVLCCVAYDSSA